MLRVTIFSVVVLGGLILFPPIGLTATVGLGFIMLIEAVNAKK